MKVGTQGYNIERLMRAVWENAKPLMWMEKRAKKNCNIGYIKGKFFHYEHSYLLHHAVDVEEFRTELQEKLDKYDTLGKRFEGCIWKISILYRNDWDSTAEWQVTFHLKIRIQSN